MAFHRPIGGDFCGPIPVSAPLVTGHGRTCAFFLASKFDGSYSAMRKVVFLTNFIPPYRLPVLRAISARLDSFQVWISTPMEKNRGWDVDFGDLHVEVQKNLTFNGWWRHPSGFSEPNSIHFPYDTVKRLRRWEPNVVISVEMGWRTFQAAIYRCLNGEARLVVWADVSCVTEEGRNFVRRLLRTWILRVADFVIVNGESGGKYVRKLGVPRSRIARIPYTTELDAFLALPVTRNRESAHRLLYCGQLVERKGLLEFLSVLQKWVEQHPDRNIEFTILGEGVLKQRLQKFRTSPNLRITFQPHTSYKSLPDYYGAAGIFVLPTRADTWGLVVNEAMASGLPVLGSTNSQAVEELVEQDKTGWRFCPDRFEDTYAAVDRALTTSVAELNAMRTASRNTAATITPASVAEKVLEVIDAASAPRRKRLALLTNIVAPYKRPIYNSLAEVMDTAVLVSGK
jgi:glycosyltransferase involved in cell wall biosynthesis